MSKAGNGIINDFSKARIKTGYNRNEISEMMEIPLNTLKQWENEQSSARPYVKKLYIDHLGTFPQVITMKEDITKEMKKALPKNPKAFVALERVDGEYQVVGQFAVLQKQEPIVKKREMMKKITSKKDDLVIISTEG